MGDREELQALRRLAELEARESGKPPPPVNLKLGAEGMGESMKAVMKEAGPAASRLAAFGSFPRQLYEGAKQIIGQGDEGNVRAVRALEEAHPVPAIGGGIATLVPLSRIPGLNTIAGQTLLGAASGGGTATLGDESRLKNALIGGGAAGGMTALLKGAANLTGRLLQRSTQKAASSAAQQSVRDATIQEARAAGYVLPPTATGGGAVASTVESLGGKAAIAQEASIRNQQVTNALARKAAGLAPDQEITEATLDAARRTLAAPYREVAALSQRAASALERLGDARLDAKDFWKQYATHPSPAARKAAIKADEMVEMLERVIEKEAAKAGKSGLVDAVKQARVALAKNFDVEKALNLGDGNVEARIIGQMLEARGVKGLTGELQVIGRVARAFRDFVRHAPVGQSAPDVSKLTPYAAALLGLGGYTASDKLGMGPWGMAAAGLPFLSGSARSVALSQLMQRVMPSYAPSAPVRLADIAARSRLPAAAAVPSALTLEQIANQ